MKHKRVRMLCKRKHIFYLATTRFNSETWIQNETYRKKYNMEGCIYGTPIRIARKIPVDSYMFILEMKNLPKSHKLSLGDKRFSYKYLHSL